MLGIISFVFFCTLSRYLQLPLNEAAFLIIGATVLLVASYTFFKSLSVFHSVVLAIALSASSYITFYVLWNSHHKIAIIIFPVIIVAAICCWAFAAYRMIRDTLGK
jgi:4-hydroxybenzoate polyprenyltransferase